MQAWIILFGWLPLQKPPKFKFKKLVFYLNQEYYASSYPQMFLGFSYIYHVEVG
jgi:hypothetical protein